MSTSSHPQGHGFRARKQFFVGHGFQLRYGLLVAGSLAVLLLFSGVHGYFAAQANLPDEAWAAFQGPLLSSTARLFLVGFIYIAVISVAALFLSHRTVGPTHRLEEEIRRMTATGGAFQSLDVREGDEFEGLARAVNELIAVVDRSAPEKGRPAGA